MASNEWLLLRLPAQDDAPLGWAVVDQTGQLLLRPSTEIDEQFAALAPARRAVVIVPASDVTRLDVPLPAGNEARLLQLAPYALEDLVSEDIDALHFAVGPRNGETGTVPTAVVSRERMQQWLARLAELQVVPVRLISEAELVPALPGHVTLVLSDDQLLLRSTDGTLLQLPAANPAMALEMLPAAAGNLADLNVTVHADADDWPRHAAAIESLGDKVASFKVQLEAGGLLGLYARELAAAHAINLLQGVYRPNQASVDTWSRWKGAAIAALALLVLHMGGSGWQLHGLNSQSGQLDRSMASLFGTVFPGQQPGADPRRQFERRLSEIAGGAAENGQLLTMLAALAAAQQNVPVAKLESLTFKTGSMQLRVGAPDASTLEQFSQALRAGGYGVEILSGQSQGESYSGQIAVKAKGT